MPDVHDDPQTDEYRASWLVRSLYIGLLAANAYLVFDWWRTTPQGVDVIARCQARVAAAKERAENCEGCARRKQKLQAAMNRMHWQAERIVEGDDVETQPEAPA